MLKRIVHIILLFSTIATIFNSCCEPEISYYNWENIGSINLDNSGETPIVSGNDSVNKNAFGYHVILHPGETSDIGHCFDYKALSEITEVKVYSQEYFDPEHAANAEITSYFLARHSNDYFSQYSEISEIIEDLNNILSESTNFEYPQFDLYLIEPPQNAGLYHFITEFSFTDQEPLYDTCAVTLIEL